MDLGSWVVDGQGVSEKLNHILWLGWDLHLLLRERFIIGVGGH